MVVFTSRKILRLIYKERGTTLYGTEGYRDIPLFQGLGIIHEFQLCYSDELDGSTVTLCIGGTSSDKGLDNV